MARCILLVPALRMSHPGPEVKTMARASTKKPATEKTAKSKATNKAPTIAKKAAARRAAAKAATRRKGNAKPADPASASRRIDAMIADLGDWRGEKLAEIRELIQAADPDVIEEWKWMGTPVWSHEGMYALANAHKEKVKLTFSHGAQLRDPKKLFNAGLKGNKWRAIDFREGDEIDRSALTVLLRAAVAYNAKHCVRKSSGSRA